MAIPIGSRSVLARWMAIPGVLAVVWSWAGGALAEETVPSLETLLSAGVENHPTVVAAKAKVALAQAELNNTRFEVSRQIIAMRGEYDTRVQDFAKAEMNLRAATQNLETAKAMRAQGTVSAQTVTDAELMLDETRSAMIGAKAKMTGPAMELQRLIRATAYNYAPAPETVQPRPPVRPLPGPVVRKMAAALDTIIPSLDFSDTPLKDVVKYLQEVAEVSITVDAITVPGDDCVSLRLKDVTLSAALQAIEDVGADMVFVVREYGLLATFIGKAEDEGYVRIRDLRNLDPGTAAPKASSDSRPPAEDQTKP